MLWGKRSQGNNDQDDDANLPPELKGKTPEQVVEALKAAEAAQAKLQQLEAEKLESDRKVADLSTEFNTTKQRLAELEASAGKTPKDQSQDDAPSIWTDPNAFIASQMKPVTDVAIVSGIMTAKMYAKSQLSTRDAKIWTNYEKEIDKVMEGYQPAQRIVPQNWLMALTLVKGHHDVDIAKAEREKTDFFMESGGSGNPPPPAEDVSNDKLTPEEEEACSKFHWDPKRYLEQKKKMVIASSSKGAYARFSVGN